MSVEQKYLWSSRALSSFKVGLSKSYPDNNFETFGVSQCRSTDIVGNLCSFQQRHFGNLIFTFGFAWMSRLTA